MKLPLIMIAVIFSIVTTYIFLHPHPLVRATKTNDKTLYLTLDADMSESMAWKYHEHAGGPWYDPRVFQYLEETKTPTTFFVSGLFAKTYPSIIASISAYPFFSIQNHSYDESSFIPNCYYLNVLRNKKTKINQIEETQKILKNITNQTPKYFRYPGLCKGPGDDDLVKSLGFTIVNGSIISGDPFNPNTTKIVNTVLRKASSSPGDGVIIMHVGGHNAPKSLAVLKVIIPKLESAGFSFKKLP